MEIDDLKETARFLGVVKELRAKCPWDRKQTHKSLGPYLVEETFELLDALETGDPVVMREEMGDLLLQIALHAEIGSETGAFDFESVARDIADKMIARHPHVYGDVTVKDADEVKANWAKLKQEEKPDRRILDGVPMALPALLLATKYGQRAAGAGFDWADPKAVLGKISEEVGELEAAVLQRDSDAIEEELGDMLFAMTQLSRKLKVDAESALRRACRKFAARLEWMEENSTKPLDTLGMDALEELWTLAKASGR